MTQILPNLELINGFLPGEDGWSSAMNDNLDTIDSRVRKVFVAGSAEYPTFQAAYDAAPAGGRIYCPNSLGQFIPPTAAGWTIDKAIEVFGDGLGSSATLAQGFGYFDAGGATGTKNSVVFNLTENARFYLHDIVIYPPSGQPASGGTGDAIRFAPASAPTPMVNLIIERCFILYAGRSGLRIGDGTQYAVHTSVRDTTIYGCRDVGVYFNLSNIINLDTVVSTTNRGEVLNYASCFYFEGCSDVSMRACTAEVAGQGLSNADYSGYVHLSSVHSGNIQCHIEDAGEAAIKNGIVINSSKGINVAGTTISFPAAAGSKAITLLNGAIGNFIGANEINFVEYAVKVDSAAADYGNVIMPQMVLNSNATAPGKITLPANHRNFALITNITAGVADNKGVGILLPCMSSAAAVDSSLLLDGLLFYDTNDDKLKLRANGTTVVVGTQT